MTTVLRRSTATCHAHGAPTSCHAFSTPQTDNPNSLKMLVQIYDAHLKRNVSLFLFNIPKVFISTRTVEVTATCHSLNRS